MAKKIWIASSHKVDLYIDFRDWWVGYYRAENYHYFCLLPALVVRIVRTIKRKPYSSDNSYGTEGW